MTTTTLAHDHSRGHALRAFPSRPGVWVKWCGDWHRPLHVWLYRGAWWVNCHVCMGSVRSDNALYAAGGWPTQAAAVVAALAHCADCPAVTAQLAGAVA